MNYNKRHKNIILISIQNSSLCTRDYKRYIMMKLLIYKNKKIYWYTIRKTIFYFLKSIVSDFLRQYYIYGYRNLRQ